MLKRTAAGVAATALILAVAVTGCQNTRAQGAASAAPAQYAAGHRIPLTAADFVHRDGRPFDWTVNPDGSWLVNGTGDIQTKNAYSDFTLHVEFKTPKLPDDVKGQARGNSGVYLQGRYEVQILDSFGLKAGNQDCGAIYLTQAPAVNACKPPGEWQTYDITFAGAKFDPAGNKTADAHVTVVQNGTKVQDNTDIPHPTGAGDPESAAPGPIRLQDHHNPVQFRNIWIEPAPGSAVVAATLAPAKLAAATLAPASITDPAPGLVGVYYRRVKSMAALTAAAKNGKELPFLVRVDPAVNFPRVEGQFYKTKLGTNFGVIWSGVVHIDKPGDYTFQLASDDGARVYLDDKLIANHPVKNADEAMKSSDSKPLALTPGDYPIRLEFTQQAGGAGVVLAWKTPGEQSFAAIPAANFAHARSAENVKWDKDAYTRATYSDSSWQEASEKKWNKMDYGRHLAATYECPDTGNIVLKGQAIQLGNATKTSGAHMVFDTELMRWGEAWTGMWLNLHGVAYDGNHGPSPNADGDLAFATKNEPGAWEGELADKPLADPRAKPWGPLPREWARYHGLYESGDKVVLSYQVGTTDVLELPGAVEQDGKTTFTRTLRLSPSTKPLVLLAYQQDEKHPVSMTASPDVTTKTIDGRHYLIFAPRTEAKTYQVAIAAGSEAPALPAGAPEDLTALLKGGPSHWGPPIVTKGEVSKDANSPYVVDTLTAPEENPSNSWFRFGGFDFFSDGTRAAVCTWNGDVWVVSGIDESLQHLQWKRYATGMFQTLGLRIVNDTVYVLGRDQITELHDLNNDGEADFYECFNNDCEVTSSFHEFCLDLQTDPQGNFYFAKAGPVAPGGRGWQILSDNNGCVLKVSADGKEFSVYATGLRAPNGMGVGPHGEISVSDNEGTWTPACRIDYDVKQGDFLGVPDTSKMSPPPTNWGKLLCWLPHGDVDNSSGGQVWVTSGNRWGPFEGDMLAMSYGKCCLFKVLKEQVDGTWQGGVVKFPLEFATGIMRGRFNNRDGQLYVCGLRGWQTTAAKDCAFQRVRYTGKPVNMPTDLHVKKDGIAIGFTAPIDPATATDGQNWDVEQWNYHWSHDYGSPEFSVEDPNQKGHDPVDVDSVQVSPDHKTVFLKIADLKPVMQMKIQMKIKAADGSPVEYSIYNTIQKIGAPNATASAAK